MEDILQIYDDLTGCGPFSFQQPLESIQDTQHQAPPLSSFGNVSFNPHQILEAASSGVCSIQQFEQPIMLEESLNYSAVNSQNYNAVNNQFPNNLVGQNMVAENSTEKIKHGWQHIQWTNEMVKILIIVVSYYEDVVVVEGSKSEWNHLLSPIKGKWQSVSRTLVERGFLVSPQQCEDKFNDLNKKYKRLVQILGTNNSYNIVENPAIMEKINIPVEAKDEVQRILSCKQLFFKELYSYHSKNDKFFPCDGPQHSMLATPTDGVKYCYQDLTSGSFMKKRKPEEANGVPHQEKLIGFTNVLPEAMEEHELSQLIITRSMQLEQKKLQIQMKMLTLEKKRFEWLKSCRKEDEELQQMMFDNKLMQLENEHQAFMLKCRKIGNPSN
ncbi:hypothetical protein ACS0TY_011644 [Phlomoides rotata]